MAGVFASGKTRRTACYRKTCSNPSKVFNAGTSSYCGGRRLRGRVVAWRAVEKNAGRNMRVEREKRFKSYPYYKDTGVECLGEIPAHWGVTPIRAMARSGYKTFTDGDWIESPFIRSEGIGLIQTGNVGIGAYKEQGFRYIDDETFRFFNCKEVFPGDVLILNLFLAAERLHLSTFVFLRRRLTLTQRL
jgi:hypothetical protein